MRLSLLDWALHYADIGFAPVPLWGVQDDGSCMCGRPTCGKSAGKHPRMGPGWEKHVSLDPDRVRELFANHAGNIGMMAGPAFLIADCDGEAGIATYKALGAPETLMQRSGSGNGIHGLFGLSPTQDRSRIKNRRVLDGIDIKHGNGQIVVHPSRHASGKLYEWINPEVPIATLPDFLYQAFCTPERSSSKPPPPPNNVVSLTSDPLKRARAYIAKMPPSIEGSDGSSALFAVARKLLKDFRLDDCDAWTLLNEYNATHAHPPWSERELRHKFEDAGKARVAAPVPDRARPRAIGAGGALALKPEPTADDWMALLAMTKPDKNNSQRVLPTLSNAQLILQHHPDMRGRLRRNLLGGVVEARSFPFDDECGGPRSGQWTDTDTARLGATLERTEAIGCVTFSSQILDAAVECVADVNAYHPVRDWLSTLTWDGVPRIDAWLCAYYGAEPTPWCKTIGPRFLIAAVARAYKPGCKVDTVLIFEGGQGVGKSTGLRELFSDDWFSDTPIEIGNKDAFQNLAGKWFIELGELSSFSRRDANSLKVFFSSNADTYRPSYGRRTVTMPRQCVFGGSTNDSTYLPDDTGNRRFWPFATGGAVDVAGITRDRAQLWAEAVVRYRAGERWWLDRDEDLEFSEERESRLVVEPWLDPIRAFLIDRDEASPAELLNTLGIPKAQWTVTQYRTIGRIVRVLGWVKGRKRTPCGPVWVYRRGAVSGSSGSGDPVLFNESEDLSFS